MHSHVPITLELCMQSSPGVDLRRDIAAFVKH
jgi:hypothetical protein